MNVVSYEEAWKKRMDARESSALTVMRSFVLIASVFVLIFL